MLYLEIIFKKKINKIKQPVLKREIKGIDSLPTTSFTDLKTVDQRGGNVLHEGLWRLKITLTDNSAGLWLMAEWAIAFDFPHVFHIKARERLHLFFFCSALKNHQVCFCSSRLDVEQTKLMHMFASALTVCIKSSFFRSFAPPSIF